MTGKSSNAELSGNEGFTIPKGLRRLTEELSSQVLLHQPPCIYKHLANFLEDKIRKMGNYKDGRQDCSQSAPSGDANKLSQRARGHGQGHDHVDGVLNDAIGLVDALEELQEESRYHLTATHHHQVTNNGHSHSHHHGLGETTGHNAHGHGNEHPFGDGSTTIGVNGHIRGSYSRTLKGCNQDHPNGLPEFFGQAITAIGTHLSRGNLPQQFHSNPPSLQQQLISCELNALSNHVDNLRHTMNSMMGCGGGVHTHVSPECYNLQAQNPGYLPPVPRRQFRTRPQIPERCIKLVEKVNRCTETGEECKMEKLELAECEAVNAVTETEQGDACTLHAEYSVHFGQNHTFGPEIESNIQYDLEGQLSVVESRQSPQFHPKMHKPVPAAPQGSRVCIPLGQTAETFKPPQGFRGILRNCSELDIELGDEQPMFSSINGMVLAVTDWGSTLQSWLCDQFTRLKEIFSNELAKLDWRYKKAFLGVGALLSLYLAYRVLQKLFYLRPRSEPSILHLPIANPNNHKCTFSPVTKCN